jgi:hypothetical protein
MYDFKKFQMKFYLQMRFCKLKGRVRLQSLESINFKTQNNQLCILESRLTWMMETNDNI